MALFCDLCGRIVLAGCELYILHDMTVSARASPASSLCTQDVTPSHLPVLLPPVLRIERRGIDRPFLATHIQHEHGVYLFADDVGQDTRPDSDPLTTPNGVPRGIANVICADCQFFPSFDARVMTRINQRGRDVA